jgi:hypothetical protein
LLQADRKVAEIYALDEKYNTGLADYIKNHQGVKEKAPL